MFCTISTHIHTPDFLYFHLDVYPVVLVQYILANWKFSSNWRTHRSLLLYNIPHNLLLSSQRWKEGAHHAFEQLLKLSLECKAGNPGNWIHAPTPKATVKCLKRLKHFEGLIMSLVVENTQILNRSTKAPNKSSKGKHTPLWGLLEGRFWPGWVVEGKILSLMWEELSSLKEVRPENFILKAWFNGVSNPTLFNFYLLAGRATLPVLSSILVRVLDFGS